MTITGHDHLDTMLEAYRRDAPTLTQKQLAAREAEIWEEVAPDVRRIWKYPERWLHDKVGGKNPHEFYARRSLYVGGSAADPLWAEIQAGALLPRTAVMLLRDAQRRAHKISNPISLADAVLDVLAKYKALPNVSLSAKGVPIRRRSPSRLPALDEVTQDATAVAAKTNGAPSSKCNGASDRAKWQNIRALFSEILAPRMAGITDTPLADRLWRELEISLNAFLDGFTAKVSMAVRREQQLRAGEIALSNQFRNKRALNAAFKTLDLRPPRAGKEINLQEVRKQYHALVRAYHPDNHAGDETTRPQYEAVVNAFATIEEFAAQTAEKEQSL